MRPPFPPPGRAGKRREEAPVERWPGPPAPGGPPRGGAPGPPASGAPGAPPGAMPSPGLTSIRPGKGEKGPPEVA